MTDRPGDAPLYRIEKFGLILFGLLIVAYGAITEIRSALLQFRHTDFNAYTHVAWCVRTGENIYASASTNGLNYVYPSPFAILMVPFADPPPFVAPDGGFYLPFAVSVAIWYAITLALLTWSVHTLAKVVLPDAIPGSRRWWYARTAPVYACIGGIGFTLGRGQVNLLIVALIVGMFAATVRGRRVGSGLWLAAAIAIKFIPALLLLFPLVRRDWRAGIGVAAGLAIGLGAIPIAVWGPREALAQHEYFIRHVVLAGSTGAGDHPFGNGLTETTATDSQSFQAAIHHIRYWNLERGQRPPHASAETRLAHMAISGALTLITLLVARRRLTADPADQLVFLGCLCAVLMVVTPVSHMHYYALVLPLVAGLWLRGLALRPGTASVDGRTAAMLAMWGIATALPLFPGPVFDRLRECGFGAAATVLLWAYGLSVMGRVPVSRDPESAEGSEWRGLRIGAKRGFIRA